MFSLYLVATLAAICGGFVGAMLANANAARQRIDVIRAAEARAFKRGELEAWQEATRRLQEQAA